MSGTTIKVVEDKQITICDICGGEISPEDMKDRSLIGSILGDDNWPARTDGTAKATDRVFKFGWPGRKRTEEFREEAKAEGKSVWFGKDHPNRSRSYDFHADCILLLVEAAVTQRKAGEAKASAATEE